MDSVAAQIQGMQLYQQTELMFQESQGKYIQQNLGQLGQYSEPTGINLQKLSQELSNVELAHKDVKMKLETARAMCSYLTMMPGPLVTVNNLKGIPQGSNAIARMNVWNALTLHLNTLAMEIKRSRIMSELENTWTMDKLVKFGKQIDICLCTFRQFIEEANLTPVPENASHKHYQDFLAALTDHVKKMIFLPEQIVTLGVLIAHGRNCSNYEMVRRLITMLHLALNIKVRNASSSERKANVIAQYMQIGDDKDREALYAEILQIIGQHYGFACQCPFHYDLNLPPNWLEFEKECPQWEDIEELLKHQRGTQNIPVQYIPDQDVREELQYRIFSGMVRQLTNTSMVAQPCEKQDQGPYCKAFHLTYSREHILVLLLKLLDRFPNAGMNFLNKKLHRLEVMNMLLCQCTHHKKFRELTQYKSSCIQSWAHTLQIHQRDEDTPERVKLGGLRKQHVIPQIWDCERAGDQIPKYIPDRIKAGAEGSLVMSMINHMAPDQATLAKLMWCINEYAESLTRQNGKHRFGQFWQRTRAYSTFVRIFRTRPRGPSYGISVTPCYHPSQVAPPVLSGLESPNFATVTPPKKSRTDTPIMGNHLLSPGHQATTALNPTVTFPNPLTISIPYLLPNYGLGMPNVTAKRKAEEVQPETQVRQGSDQSVFKTPLPRIISRGASRMQPPPGIRTQPLPPDQRHFPPGPQKAIRVPTRILRRKESEYERGSLRVQPTRQTQTPTKMMREIDEVQQIQKLISTEELARATRDQEMGTPIPQVSNQEVDQNEQNQNQVPEEKLSSTSHETSSSNSLDLEEMMEQTELKTVHQNSPVKES